MNHEWPSVTNLRGGGRIPLNTHTHTYYTIHYTHILNYTLHTHTLHTQNKLHYTHILNYKLHTHTLHTQPKLHYYTHTHTHTQAKLHYYTHTHTG